MAAGQCGFRQQCTTNHPLHEVTDFIMSSINSKLKPMAIFLELKKAFETVHHRLLLNRLERAGIRGTVLNLRIT